MYFVVQAVTVKQTSHCDEEYRSSLNHKPTNRLVSTMVQLPDNVGTSGPHCARSWLITNSIHSVSLYSAIR